MIDSIKATQIYRLKKEGKLNTEIMKELNISYAELKHTLDFFKRRENENKQKVNQE